MIKIERFKKPGNCYKNMTLILVAKCRDGIVTVYDRQTYKKFLRWKVPFECTDNVIPIYDKKVFYGVA